MSWYSDGEKFDERDMPWCERCPHGDQGGDSYEECEACCRRHERKGDQEEDEEVLCKDCVHFHRTSVATGKCGYLYNEKWVFCLDRHTCEHAERKREC